jgi:hypothetical protein
MMRLLRYLSAAALATLVVAAPAAHAATTTFGATLEAVTPNSDPAKTCSAGAWWYAEQGVLLNPVPSGDRGSCQFTASGFFNGQVFGLAAPASGTVTAARIKVGSITGPMRINVVRTLFQQTGNVGSPLPSTPFLQRYGPTFTPQANAVTTVPLDLKVGAQATPDPTDTSTVAGTDWLAIEVLAPDVPVPLVPYPNGTFFAAFPGPTAAGVPAPSPNPLPNYGQLNYVVAMNADLVTGGGTTPGPTTGGKPTPAPTGGAKVGLRATTAQVAGGRALLDLVCRAADCAGTVTLRPAAGAAAKSATTYGSARFSLKAGARAKVRVTLNRRGKRLLARKRRAKVRAVVTLAGAPGPVSLGVTLRR